jgi:hypothetical protein
MEPADLWLDYLEPQFRDRAIRIERRDGVEHLIIGEESVLAGMLAGLGGAHRDRSDLFTPGRTYADGCEPASYDPAARVAMLDAWGVDVGVLFPTIGILPFPTEDIELASAYCRAYNRWQMDFAAGAPGRVAPHRGGQLARRRRRGGRAADLPQGRLQGPVRAARGDRRPPARRGPLRPHLARLREAGVPGCLPRGRPLLGAPAPSAPGTPRGPARSSPSAWAPPAS